jgi:hypothetical protein
VFCVFRGLDLWRVRVATGAVALRKCAFGGVGNDNLRSSSLVTLGCLFLHEPDSRRRSRYSRSDACRLQEVHEAEASKTDEMNSKREFIGSGVQSRRSFLAPPPGCQRSMAGFRGWSLARLARPPAPGCQPSGLGEEDTRPEEPYYSAAVRSRLASTVRAIFVI